MFNFNKYAQTQGDTSLSYQKKLEKKRGDEGQKEPSEGTTERQLAAQSHKDKDNTVPFNAQLAKERSGTVEAVTDAQLDGEKLYNDKRDDRTHGQPSLAQNLVHEAFHKDKVDAYREAQRDQERDTSFWDKNVGEQMIGPKTTIVKNKQESQLANHPDRFESLSHDLKTEPKSLVYAEEIASALKQADAMQFQIFATAAKMGRSLTDDEQQKISDINSGKARLITKADESK